MKLFNFDSMKFEEGDSKMIALAASAAAYAVETEEGVIPDTLDEVSAGAAFRILSIHRFNPAEARKSA